MDRRELIELRGKAQAMEKQLQEASNKLATTQEEKSCLDEDVHLAKVEIEGQRKQIARLRTENDELTAQPAVLQQRIETKVELKEAQEELSDERAKRNEAEKIIVELQAQLQKSQQESAKLRQQLEDANKMADNVVKLEAELEDSNGLVANLQKAVKKKEQ